MYKRSPYLKDTGMRSRDLIRVPSKNYLLVEAVTSSTILESTASRLSSYCAVLAGALGNVDI